MLTLRVAEKHIAYRLLSLLGPHDFELATLMYGSSETLFPHSESFAAYEVFFSRLAYIQLNLSLPLGDNNVFQELPTCSYCLWPRIS